MRGAFDEMLVVVDVRLAAAVMSVQTRSGAHYSGACQGRSRFPGPPGKGGQDGDVRPGFPGQQLWNFLIPVEPRK